MKKILYLLLDKWADWEFAYISSAVNMLGNGKFSNKTVALGKECVTSIGGLKCVPDYSIDEIPQDYAALILIGGLSWRSDDADKVKQLALDCAKSGRVLGAICDACRFLATTGVLNEAQHTANDIRELKAYSAYNNEKEFLHRQAARGANIITANGTAPLEFAAEVMRALQVADEGAIKEWYDFHKLGLYTAAMPNMR